MALAATRTRLDSAGSSDSVVIARVYEAGEARESSVANRADGPHAGPLVAGVCEGRSALPRAPVVIDTADMNARFATIVVPRVIGRMDDAQIAKAKTEISVLASALNMYKLDNFNYPGTDQGLAALIARPAGQPEARNWRSGGYLERGSVPKDPNE